MPESNQVPARKASHPDELGVTGNDSVVSSESGTEEETIRRVIGRRGYDEAEDETNTEGEDH